MKINRFILLLFVAGSLFGQEPFKLPRLSGAVKLDGVIDEPAWAAIPPLPLVMHQPTYRGAMRESTEVRIAYDDNYIYMSGKLFHRDPADIRANSLYRDRWSGDDTFSLVLDTFNDNENALWFFINPLGTRVDMAVSNDGVGGFSAVNGDWNTFWDAATTITEEGWFAEIRFPFTSLRFQDDNGRVVMGMIAYRFIAVTNERYIWPDIPPTWERASNKPSVAQDVVLEGIYSRNPVYVTPYLLGGFNQLPMRTPAGDRYSLDTDRTGELGMDVKYNLTANLTLDATLNTDFAQVEADDQQINLTRFSLFFPEKRQFFQERAGIFDFRLGGDGRLFHSRRIGLRAGRPIRIYGGGRLVGRMGKWDVGLLSMQTARSDSLPGENFGVLRLRRNVLNANSDIGAMTTTRLGNDGRYNLAYGMDASLRLHGDDYLILKWAQTVENAVLDAGKFDPLETGRFLISLERQRFDGFIYQGTVAWSGKNFNPGIGFDTRQDFLYLANRLSYQQFLPAHPRLRKLGFSTVGFSYLRNADRTVESAWIQPSVTVEANNGTMVTLAGNHFYEDVREAFEISERVDIPAGKYGFHELALAFTPPDGWRLRPGVNFSAGSFYDGAKYALQVSPTWNLSRNFELSGFYALNLLRFTERVASETIHLARLRMNIAVNNRASLNSFVQFNSAGDLVSINTRFRYNFAEGSDLWLVYNEGVNTDRGSEPGRPHLRQPLTNNRAVMLKYTYTLIR